MASLRTELEATLTTLIAAQHAPLRTLVNSALALPNISDTVFYGLMLRWPRPALRFFQTGLPQSVALVEPTGTTTPLTSLFLTFAATLQQKGRTLLGLPSTSSEVEELRASFAVFLGQLHRRGEAVPTQLTQLISGRANEDNTEAVVEQVEFSMFLEDVMAANGRAYRNLSWDNTGAAAAFIRDVLAGRESIGQDVILLRTEVERLVSTGVLRPLDVLVGEFRLARRGAAVNVVNANPTKTPSPATSYHGFQSSSKARESSPASSSDDDDALMDQTILWTDVENWLAGTRAEPRPRCFCFCFCSNELFVPQLEGDSAAADQDKEPLRLLGCGHVVGAVCMTAWKDTCGSLRCPWCLQL